MPRIAEESRAATKGPVLNFAMAKIKQPSEQWAEWRVWTEERPVFWAVWAADNRLMAHGWSASRETAAGEVLERWPMAKANPAPCARHYYEQLRGEAWRRYCAKIDPEGEEIRRLLNERITGADRARLLASRSRSK